MKKLNELIESGDYEDTNSWSKTFDQIKPFVQNKSFSTIQLKRIIDFMFESNVMKDNFISADKKYGTNIVGALKHLRSELEKEEELDVESSESDSKSGYGYSSPDYDGPKGLG